MDLLLFFLEVCGRC